MKIKLYQCGGQSPYSEYPLGLAYLRSNCDEDVEIVRDSSELRDCDLIGLSSCAWGLREAIDILQRTSIPVVLGGEGTMWDGLADYDFACIVIGEGETYFRNWKDMYRILRTDPLPIDSIKPPDRGRIISRWVPILSSRGCPFSCAYCSATVFWGKPRYHSPEYFIDEMKHLSERYPNQHRLRILDDLFTSPKRRFMAIADLWMRNDLHKRWRPRAMVAARSFDREIARTMKSMGFERIRFGAESGSDKVLAIMKKGATVEDNQQLIDVANGEGLRVTASYIYGCPGESPEDLDATKRFIRRNRRKCKVEGWNQFRGFPGTPLWDGKSPLEGDMRIYKL